MSTSQAFRIALHIPVIDPGPAEVVSTIAGGDMYTSGWVTTSGISEAPTDGQQYGRQSAGWTVVPEVVEVTWGNLPGKPATFPPTLPIPWSGLSGVPATFPPTLPIPWADVSGKPATFPPTLPIAQSGVTNLTTDLAAKAPLASPPLTGTPTTPTATLGTNTTQIASTAFVQTAVTAGVASVSIDAGTFP
jgi:hypothetical protein